MTEQDIQITPRKDLAPAKELTPDSPKVVLGFRSNRLYDKVMSQIAEQMRVQGINANLISFPAGTSPEEINANLTHSWTDFRGSTVYTDATVGKSIEYNLYERANALGIMVNPYFTEHPEEDGSPESLNWFIDDRFNDLAIKAILGAQGVTSPSEVLDYQGSSDMDQTGKAFSALLGIALKKQAPKNIFIAPQALEAHSPFYDIKSNEGEGEPISPADHIQKWIQEAGYPAEKIKILQENRVPFDDRRDAWVIADRHNQLGFYPVTIFEMPLANLLEGLQKKELVTVEDVPSIEKVADAVAAELVELTLKVEPYKQKLIADQATQLESEDVITPSVVIEREVKAPKTPAWKRILDQIRGRKI